MKVACISALVLCLAVFAAGDAFARGEEAGASKGRIPIVTVAAPDSVGELPEGVSVQASPLGSIDEMSAALVKAIGVKSHFHPDHAELVYVLEGSGTFVLGDTKVHAAEGTVALIPSGVSHSFTADGEKPCLVLSVKVPPSKGSDMIYDE